MIKLTYLRTIDNVWFITIFAQSIIMTMKKKIMIAISIFIGIIIAILLAGYIFLNTPAFGRLPQGERLERINRSPHYRNGQFHNLQSAPLITSKRSKLSNIWRFLTDKPANLIPSQPISAVKSDLKALPCDSDLIVWFGHSSYMLQLSGRRFLVDPVFYKAAPVAFVNKPFPGTDIYKPCDMPEYIDYLVISHDHWDHLDYNTVKELRNRVGKVICPLGVGEHFEYWGYDKSQLIELDWNESADLQTEFVVHCLPARHFSGRGLTSNKTLWASFLIDTPSLSVFIGGDSGYGNHFKEIGHEFTDIDIAILENGQYNEEWKYIHTMPDKLGQAATDLGCQNIITVHHSKYALARHPWNEPLDNEQKAAKENNLKLTVLCIGVPTPLYMK